MNVARILFPTDFSPGSEQAFDHALYQADLLDAELHILHCITWSDKDKLSHGRLPDPDTVMRHLQNVAAVQMKEAIEPHKNKPFNIVEKVIAGPRPVETILHYIETHEIGLLVMGTHGRQGLTYFLMGSNAEEIVRSAPCPVITVREKGARCSLGAITKILVPVDFSDASRQAVIRGKYMAEMHEAELIVKHVIQKLDFPTTGPDAGFTFVKEWLPRLEKEHTEHLEKLVAETKGPNVPTQCRVDIGNPAREIVHEAEQDHVDFIVMPTHGHTGFNRLLMGSVAERVIRTAPCPVYTDRFRD